MGPFQLKSALGPRARPRPPANGPSAAGSSAYGQMLLLLIRYPPTPCRARHCYATDPQFQGSPYCGMRASLRYYALFVAGEVGSGKSTALGEHPDMRGRWFQILWCVLILCGVLGLGLAEPHDQRWRRMRQWGRTPCVGPKALTYDYYIKREVVKATTVSQIVQVGISALYKFSVGAS